MELKRRALDCSVVPTDKCLLSFQGETCGAGMMTRVMETILPSSPLRDDTINGDIRNRNALLVEDVTYLVMRFVFSL